MVKLMDCNGGLVIYLHNIIMSISEKIKVLKLRDKLIARVEVLDKVKGLLLLPNTDCMTTKMLADYYKVDMAVIRQRLEYHKEELMSDGIKRYSFKEIKALVNSENFSQYRISGQGVNLFPKRAVLRIGMLLRDSEVAKEVRTQLLNIVEKVEDKVKVETIAEEKTSI
jgi:hypothetical protein